MEYKLWINADRTVLVRQWENGRVEVCLRSEQDAIWGPPIRLEPDAVTA